MDLNLLTIFLCVYKHRSITVASEELDMSQPAVSAALKRLESSINKPLFVREGRGIAPTGAAVSLANKVESPLSVLETIGQEDEHLNVYCSEMVLLLVSQVDGVSISATPLKEQDVIDDIITQKVDLVIEVMRTKQGSMVVEDIHQEQAVCLVREDHPRIGDSLSEEQYFSEQHIALKIRREEQTTVEYLAEKPIQKRSVKVETDSVASMLAITAETDYIASSTYSVAKKLAPKLGLKILPYPISLKPITLSFVYHRRFLNDKYHQSKREEIKSLIQSLPTHISKPEV
ncbi:LysR family transcriptional regulator [Vibrio owensii]|uniref:LysR family transcriptional regulator n=1 Tax=Vibrio owensii TaxID=696485 RepID=UPI003AABCB0B